jgi:hypothetical protein
LLFYDIRIYLHYCGYHLHLSASICIFADIRI